MLKSATVENFRGIERLKVENLGRVNLIIGRNDSGKTALMEALELGVSPEGAGTSMVSRQSARNVEGSILNFDSFWLPIFGQLDAVRGFRVEVKDESGSSTQLKVSKPKDVPLALNPGSSTFGAPLQKSWELNYRIYRESIAKNYTIRFAGKELELPDSLPLSDGLGWIAPSPSNINRTIGVLSTLKRQGRDHVVTRLMQLVNAQVSGIEILAPTDARAQVFVRVEQSFLLPLSMFGEGLKRTFELAVTLAAAERSVLFIDEVENGLHHSTLESLWKWIAEVSQLRNTQVFATTHSEECVQAACRAFTQRENDDGLRVIRLDKQAHETKAVVYDRNLVEAAARMGVEIRG